MIMLIAVLVSNLISQHFRRISTPLIQIALGIALALLPVFHFSLTLDPELFLVLFIAPLLFEDAKKADKLTLWGLKRPILLLALGLVFATCLGVGAFIKVLIPVIPLAAAFALAAALAPTDAVAVISLKESSTIKPQKRAILQGESLFNDASSIVSFQFALAALAVGPFAASATLDSLHFTENVILTFLFMFIGGVLVGLGLMVLRFFLVRLIRRAGTESITFHVIFEVLTPFLVFLIAEALHVSGIIAVVVAGIAHSFVPRRHSPSSARHSIVSSSVWSVLTFILNGLVFLILGTQLPHVIQQVWLHSNANHSLLILAIVLILLAILALRFVWVLIMNRKELLASEAQEAQYSANTEEHLVTFEEIAKSHKENKHDKERVNRKERKLHKRELIAQERRTPGYFKAHARNALLLTLTGVKGAITLALLLTIPLLLPTGEAFPERDLLLFLASGVIMLSLLLANFLVPLIAPKTQDSSADEAELKAISEICHRVISRLSEEMQPHNRLATEIVQRQYHERLTTLRLERRLTDTEEAKLRAQIIEWERLYTLQLIDEGRVNVAVGTAYIYQLSRLLARIEHHNEARWLVGNIVRQLVHQLRSRRQHQRIQAHVGMQDDGAQPLGRRQALKAVQELQYLNYSHVLVKLEGLQEESKDQNTTIQGLIIDYEQRMLRLDGNERRRSHVGQQFTQTQRAELDANLREVRTHALQYERDAIENSFSEGHISHETARKLRDSVAMMELDMEEQLE